MIKLERKFVEKQLKRKVIDGAICLGVDPASRAGWAIAEVKEKHIEIDCGFINIKSKDILEKYNYIAEFFDNLIKTKMNPNNDKCVIVIEDVFFGLSVNTLKVLARIGMIIYIYSLIHKIPRRFVLPMVARSFLGLKGNGKKEVVQEQFKKLLNLELEDEDIIDAIVLSLNGVLRENNLDI